MNALDTSSMRLKQRARPALLVFDTYEAAGEAQDWMEKQLLPSLIRATWLRVVMAGNGAGRWPCNLGFRRMPPYSP